MNNVYDTSHCQLCPRMCNVERTAGNVGVCGKTSSVQLSRAALHFWEEPPISGEAGSGTVFFSGCTLKCVYCQNRDISLGEVGRTVSIERLAQIFLEQQARGALNINLVTPTHYSSQIVAAIDLARGGKLEPDMSKVEKLIYTGDPTCLNIPVVYNTSGYENPDLIRALDGYVDIFLTDFKYASASLSQKYSKAVDYPHIASKALDAMFEVVGPAQFGCGVNGERDIMEKGIIVRHLMLPGQLEDSMHVVEELALKPYSDDIFVSLMNQYTPLPGIADSFPELDCTIDESDYNQLIEYALDLGLENSFMQEGGTAEESFIPSFGYQGL